jgi:urease beta subunit
MANWASRGAAANKDFEQEHQQKEAQHAAKANMWRFYIKVGEEARLTFIDGYLDADGALDAFSYPQHQVFSNGNWNNFFVCTKHAEPCPLCESGDSPSRVAVLTVIDHTERKSKDGQKTYKDQKRLFVMKYDTYQILQNMAQKRGGLAGCTVDAYRTGDRSANVGSSFDFIEKNDPDQLKTLFTKQVDDAQGNKIVVSDFTAAEYEKEIPYRTSQELAALGYSAAAPAMGAMDSQAAKPADYAGNL